MFNDLDIMESSTHAHLCFCRSWLMTHREQPEVCVGLPGCGCVCACVERWLGGTVTKEGDRRTREGHLAGGYTLEKLRNQASADVTEATFFVCFALNLVLFFLLCGWVFFHCSHYPWYSADPPSRITVIIVLMICAQHLAPCWVICGSRGRRGRL